MLGLLLAAVGAVLVTVGLIAISISLYGVLRMPNIYSQLHAAGLTSGFGVIAILLASVATLDAAIIARAALVGGFLLLTAPVSSHAIAWAAHRRRAGRAGHGDPEGAASPPP